MSGQGVGYEIIFQMTEHGHKKGNCPLQSAFPKYGALLCWSCWCNATACAHIISCVDLYLPYMFLNIKSNSSCYDRSKVTRVFRKKNDEDNCFIREENVYQQIGYRKNRGPLVMWFRARLDTSHKTDSFALQKYMRWIARRSNGESARHYFQPGFTYSLLFVKRPLRHSMARCHVRWNRYRGDWKSYLQLHEASGDNASPAVHAGREDAVNSKGWQMRQHWQGFMECWKTPHQTVSTRTKSSCRMKRWKIASCSQRWEIQKLCKKDSLPEEGKKQNKT